MSRVKSVSHFILSASILLLLSAEISHSQKKPLCYQCGEKITGKFIEAEGKTFHTEHFICAGCGKVIETGYQLKEGEFSHPECFKLREEMKCGYCGKTLDGSYVMSKGEKYHSECYENFILPKCSICGLPLKGSYQYDHYKNRYHAFHKDELDKCHCCGRLICEAITGGGREYTDGRHICNICFSSAVTDGEEFEEILKKGADKLRALGVRLNEKNITVTGVDRQTLKSRDIYYSDDTRGYCYSLMRTESLNGKVVKKENTHHIYVLSGMPRLLTESTVVHELMHAWINDNTGKNHPARILEGSCNYISYLYLKSLNHPDASDLIMMLENDPSPVYGKGFLEIRSRYEGKGISELLNFLKR